MKHQFLVHDIQEKYYMDEGETIEVGGLLASNPKKYDRIKLAYFLSFSLLGLGKTRP